MLIISLRRAGSTGNPHGKMENIIRTGGYSVDGVVLSKKVLN
jgi:hypothetical protein